ncbi:hypothetical protein D9M73_262270 [compost metagenome]
MCAQHLFNARVTQGQRLVLIGLLQPFEQGLQLQVRDLLAQAFSQACAEAVGEIMGADRSGFIACMGH